MRRILIIALNDLRLMFAERSIWINLVIVPLVITFAVGMANQGMSGGDDTNQVNLDVIDQDRSPLSAQLLQQIVAANEAVRLCPAQDTDSAEGCALDGQALTIALAQERLADGVSLAVVEIPAGFEAAARAGEPVEIVYRSNENVASPSFVLQALQAAISRVSSTNIAVRVGEQVAGDIDYLTFADDADRDAFLRSIETEADAMIRAQPIQVMATQSTVAGQAETTASGFQQSVPGMGSMYVLFQVLPMSVAFLRDRKLWTMQRALTMPVSRAQIMGGKVLAYFLIGMIQLSLIFGFGYLLGLRTGSNPFALVLTMVAFTLAATGLALLLTTFIRTETQAASTNLLVALTMAPLGGAWWPLEIVPDWMRVVGHISPIAWAMDAYNALMFRDAGLSGVLLPVSVLLGIAALCFGIGVMRYRFGD